MEPNSHSPQPQAMTEHATSSSSSSSIQQQEFVVPSASASSVVSLLPDGQQQQLQHLLPENSWTLDDTAIPSLRFPQKLWRIVNECKSGAISWGSSGQTVRLHYSRFQEEYLSGDASIFKTTNIASFIRQLNLYGFRKLASSGSSREPHCPAATTTPAPVLQLQQDVHEFTHEHFREGRLDLLSRVCRKTAAKRSAGAAGAPAAKSGLKRKAADRDVAAAANDDDDPDAGVKVTMDPAMRMMMMSTATVKQEVKEAEQEEVMGCAVEGLSRLQLCQLALTQALEQATMQYKREKFWLQLTNKNIPSETLQPRYETATLDHNVEIVFHDVSSDLESNLQIVEDSSMDSVVSYQEVLSLSNDNAISISVPY